MDYETIKDNDVTEETMKRFTSIQEYTSRISHIKSTLLPDAEGIKEYYECNNIETESVNILIECLNKELLNLETKKRELGQ